MLVANRVVRRVLSLLKVSLVGAAGRRKIASSTAPVISTRGLRVKIWSLLAATAVGAAARLETTAQERV